MLIEHLDVYIVRGQQMSVFCRFGTPALGNPLCITSPYDTTWPVAALYFSGNLLLICKALLEMRPPFSDLRHKFIGGGDSDLLIRTVYNGFKLCW